ncbi:MAG: DMT family transporter [Firmicutes bacterium]|nr:DMT family transporter [Bacillota bacterium]
MDGELLALGSALGYSALNILIKKGLQWSNPGTALFITVVVNNLVFGLGLAWLWAAGALPLFDWRGVAYFALSGVAATLVGRAANFETSRRLGAARASLLRIFAPLFAALISFLFLGEVFGAANLAGVLLVLAGLILLGLKDLYRSSPHRDGSIDRDMDAGGRAGEHDRKEAAFPPQEIKPDYLGYFLGIISGLTYGLSFVFRKLGLIYMPSPITGAAVSSITALVGNAGWLAFTGGWNKIGAAGRPASVLFILGGLGGSAAWFFGYQALLTGRTYVVSVVTHTELLFTVLLASVFLKAMERITWHVIASAVLVFAGVVLVRTV